ncbi:MAG: hypothetical protein K5771_03100 [Oscillospiraceae bacterium]|nr:hypothetical protein [Oscillospiraceae bacterium]
MKNTTKKAIIRGLFNEINAVKAELRKELSEITDNNMWSSEYKIQQRVVAREKAIERLNSIKLKSEDALSEMNFQPDPFDYTNPKMLEALNFINAAGNKLPEAAVSAMLDAFKGKAEELKFLKKVFESNLLYEYAVIADEAAKEASKGKDFQQKLGDFLYYSAGADPEKEIDFSGIDKELEEYFTDEG